MRVRVGFSRGKTWIGKLICFFTRTGVSHAFFLVQSEAGEWVYEAHAWEGFRRVPWETYTGSNTVLNLVDVEWPHYEVKRALDQMIGAPYPILTFVVMSLLIVMKRAARRPERLVSDGFDCVSSVVRIAKEYAKIDLGTVITPAELEEKFRGKR